MQEGLEFFKMSGAGNDFILADNRLGSWSGFPLEKLARGLCRRGLSVGADGLILVEGSAKASIGIRIFNSDGSPSDMCGNGARCAARFALLKVITGRRLTIETRAGVLDAEVLGDGAVRVDIPGGADEPERVDIPLGDRTVPAFLTSTGVPHLVVFVKDAARVPVLQLGTALRRSPEAGPDGANVNFVAVGGGEPFPVRTFERGVEGETLACGTGVAAVAWVLHRRGLAGSDVALSTRSGKVLRVSIAAGGATGPKFRLTGEARLAYRGFLSRESLQEAIECS